MFGKSRIQEGTETSKMIFFFQTHMLLFQAKLELENAIEESKALKKKAPKKTGPKRTILQEIGNIKHPAPISKVTKEKKPSEKESEPKEKVKAEKPKKPKATKKSKVPPALLPGQKSIKCFLRIQNQLLQFRFLISFILSR